MDTLQANPPRMLDTRAAAAFTGLSASTLNKLRITGGGPDFRKLGPRRVVYDPRDLQAWLEQHRRRSTSDRGAAR